MWFNGACSYYEKILEINAEDSFRKEKNRIKEGEIIYFKNSGEPVTIRAEVESVMQFSDLTPEKIKDILDKYGDDDGIEKEDIPKFFELFKNKKYCMLIFLRNPQKTEPFQISKKGFGMMSAWISVTDINNIKISYFQNGLCGFRGCCRRIWNEL